MGERSNNLTTPNSLVNLALQHFYASTLVYTIHGFDFNTCEIECNYLDAAMPELTGSAANSGRWGRCVERPRPS